MAPTIAVLGIRGIPANYGGLETCADEVTRYWASRGLDVLVYCRKQRYPTRPDNVDGVRLKYISSLEFKSLDTLSHTLFSIVDLLINERGIEVVHLYNLGNGILLPILKLFRKRVVVSGDGLEWKREKWGRLARFMHKLGERIAVSMADVLVVDNEIIRQYFVERYGVKPELIAYGAKLTQPDVERSAEVLKKFGLQAKRYFFFVGRLVPEKGVLELVKAYEQLDTEMPLVIVGDDNKKSAYKAQLLAHQSDRVRFLGYMYGAEKDQLLANALIYVSASGLEGTSPALLEAMGARVCALVNGIAENRSSVGDAAVLFDENDYHQLRLKWQQLIDQPELVAQMSQRGYEHVMTHYRWESIADDYLSVFEKCK